ncbi:hypothetical protein GCM10009105_00110 [Dokdonella soli]|uniref:Uncharacterized protein n=1 Tax=Dokdonella soli TaxID=529810 RepID=A0ABN1IB16_9GAMM
MGQVETALAGNQELAPDRTHAIEEIDLRARRARDFGCHQAGRSAADDGNMSDCGGRAACGRAQRTALCLHHASFLQAYPSRPHARKGSGRNSIVAHTKHEQDRATGLA